jgi:hypothetical protein
MKARGACVARLLVLILGAVLCIVGAPAVSVAFQMEQAPGLPTGPAPDDARRIAEADPRVAAVLQGLQPSVEGGTWGEGDGQSGATLIYRWPAENTRSVAAVWPLLVTGASEAPAPPYEGAEHRLRVDDLTALRVDVLPHEDRVLQIRPLQGDKPYDLREETWRPFSWLPWFTEQPWVLAPVFIGVALLITASAWRRSRAWNRRTPSMTRHDRQFIGRLSVILFLVAGLVWQVYEAIYAVRSPSVDVGGFAASDLAALPLLLFPPALFFAALALEFSPGEHRVAWGLVALIAGAGSVYNLATATIGVAGNLNLSYYILLGVLALLTAPRAFSAGRMGWSRHGMPRYS